MDRESCERQEDIIIALDKFIKWVSYKEQVMTTLHGSEYGREYAEARQIAEDFRKQLEIDSNCQQLKEIQP